MNTPYRLWSLLEMLRFYADRFVEIMSFVQSAQQYLKFWKESDESGKGDRPFLKKLLTNGIPLMEEIGLRQSVKKAAVMAADCDHTYITRQDLADDIDELMRLVNSELEDGFFFHLSEREAKFYTQSEPLFGMEVNDKFKRAIDDIEDAGKCIGLGQGTAAVMHLMRIMEVGLKELSNSLGIPYAPSWESYLTQIQNSISVKHNKKPLSWKKSESFFRDISGDLISVKQAWRNPTMHIDRRYSPDEAEEIMRAVRTLMQRLARDLPAKRVTLPKA